MLFFRLDMKDSLGPLKALLVASDVNGFDHAVLCNGFGHGIVCAAWATMASYSKHSINFYVSVLGKGHSILLYEVLLFDM